MKCLYFLFISLILLFSAECLSYNEKKGQRGDKIEIADRNILFAIKSSHSQDIPTFKLSNSVKFNSRLDDDDDQCIECPSGTCSCMIHILTFSLICSLFST